MRESAKKNWPLRHRCLNKTKPQCLSQRLGQKGLYFGTELLKYALFAQRTTSQSLRIRQTIQLPHAAPSTKKPPPKLVFLWPVIKTWVWMRASVSPGKITHTHSQRGGTNAVYSGSPRHLIGKKRFILSWLAAEHNWPGYVLHLSNSPLPFHVDVCSLSLDTYVFAFLSVHACSRKEKPSAPSWLALELWNFAIKPWQPARLAPDFAERRRCPSQAITQTTRTEKPNRQRRRSSQSNFHYCGESLVRLPQTFMHTEVCACTGVL